MTSFLEQYWPEGVPFTDFVIGAVKKAELWQTQARRAVLHDDERIRASDLPGKRTIIVLMEDWCGDAARSVPTLAALAEASSQIELCIVDSGKHPAALDNFLTKAARAIPIALVFNEEGEFMGVWGPRPAPLQALLRSKLRIEGSPGPEDKESFYEPIMKWYAEDRGRTVAQELLMVLERS